MIGYIPLIQGHFDVHLHLHCRKKYIRTKTVLMVKEKMMHMSFCYRKAERYALL